MYVPVKMFWETRVEGLASKECQQDLEERIARKIERRKRGVEREISDGCHESTEGENG
jgi:hypothetical protein